MKLLVEPSNKEFSYNSDLILGLKNYSNQSIVEFTIEEIEKLSKEHEVFVKLNKSFSNDEIKDLEEVMKKLDKMNIKGVFFYDLALVQIKRDLNLNLDLIWDESHMVNNYKTCNYYYNLGVKYALLSKEITMDEIEEIMKNTTITPMVEVVSIPSIAFSKRKLLTNYYKDMNKKVKNKLDIEDKISKQTMEVIEEESGTSFYLKHILNGTSIIKNLYELDCKYIIFREYLIEEFNELVEDTKKYIEGNCLDDNYIEKYKKLGDNMGFFYKKTIYRVVKDAK